MPGVKCFSRLWCGLLAILPGCAAKLYTSPEAGAGPPQTTVAAPTLPASPAQEQEGPHAAQKAKTPEPACKDCLERTLSVLPPRHSQEAVERLFLSMKQPGHPLLADTANAKASRVMLAALSNSALDAAFGMEPEGEVLGAELLEGERAARNVQLMPGKCLTFVAQGGLGTVEVDMALLRNEEHSVSVIALDEQEGPIAVLGRGSACLRHSEAKPFSGTLSVLMRKGGGLVLVRSYQR